MIYMDAETKMTILCTLHSSRYVSNYFPEFNHERLEFSNQFHNPFYREYGMIYHDANDIKHFSSLYLESKVPENLNKIADFFNRIDVLKTISYMIKPTVQHCASQLKKSNAAIMRVDKLKSQIHEYVSQFEESLYYLLCYRVLEPIEPGSHIYRFASDETLERNAQIFEAARAQDQFPCHPYELFIPESELDRDYVPVEWCPRRVRIYDFSDMNDWTKSGVTSDARLLLQHCNDPELCQQYPNGFSYVSGFLEHSGSFFIIQHASPKERELFKVGDQENPFVRFED